MLDRAKFYEACGKEWLFPSIQDAVHHAQFGDKLVSVCMCTVHLCVQTHVHVHMHTLVNVQGNCGTVMASLLHKWRPLL